MTDLVLLGAAHVHVPDHLRVARASGARVVAVVDHDAARAAYWADKLNVRVADDIADIGAAAAIVASENARHEAYVDMALDAGLPVLCEKPLAADSAAALRMVEHAKSAGLLLDTAFSLRADKTVAGLSDQIRGGALGPVLSARVRYAHDGAIADWLDLSGWMTDPCQSGYGGFGDEAIHALDWLIWTLGPVASCKAWFGHAMGFDVDDHGVASLMMQSGATAVVEGGWTDRGVHFEAEVLGKDACAEIVMGADQGHARIVGRDGVTRWEQATAPLDAGAAVIPFLRAVREGAAPLVAPDDAAAVVRTLDWLYGRTV